MKRNVLNMLLAGVILSAMTLSAFAAEFVYITKSGTKYHHKESKFIKGREVERITKAEAEEKGLTPVKGYEASPEDITDDKKSK